MQSTPVQTRSTPVLLAHLGQCWRGEASLAVVFWFWGFFVGNLWVAFAISQLTTGLSSLQLFWSALGAEALENGLPGPAPAPLDGFYALSVPFVIAAWATYFTWHVVAVWRTSAHASCPAARWSVRLFYGAVIIVFIGCLVQLACLGGKPAF